MNISEDEAYAQDMVNEFESFIYTGRLINDVFLQDSAKNLFNKIFFHNYDSLSYSYFENSRLFRVPNMNFLNIYCDNYINPYEYGFKTVKIVELIKRKKDWQKARLFYNIIGNSWSREGDSGYFNYFGMSEMLMYLNPKMYDAYLIRNMFFALSNSYEYGNLDDKSIKVFKNKFSNKLMPYVLESIAVNSVLERKRNQKIIDKSIDEIYSFYKKNPNIFLGLDKSYFPLKYLTAQDQKVQIKYLANFIAKSKMSLSINSQKRFIYMYYPLSYSLKDTVENIENELVEMLGLTTYYQTIEYFDRKKDFMKPFLDYNLCFKLCHNYLCLGKGDENYIDKSSTRKALLHAMKAGNSFAHQFLKEYIE